MHVKKLVNILPLKVYDELEAACIKHNIDNPIHIAHFISQVSHESGQFKILYENLNYSVQALLRVFPKYFKDIPTAQQHARNAKKIANRVYSNRMGNGDEASGDGYKFRGRGYIQLTGKKNYELFSNYIGEDCVLNPDLVATKYPMESAVWFFNRNKIWDLCDKADHSTVVAVTKAVNGGTNGLADRLTKFKTYINILSGNTNTV